MWIQKLSLITVVVSLSAVAAQAKVQHLTPAAPLTPEQTELIEKSFAREKVTIEEIQRKKMPLSSGLVLGSECPCQSCLPCDPLVSLRIAFRK